MMGRHVETNDYIWQIIMGKMEYGNLMLVTPKYTLVTSDCFVQKRKPVFSSSLLLEYH